MIDRADFGAGRAHGDHGAADHFGHLVGHFGRSAPADDDPGRGGRVERRQLGRGAGRQGHLDRRERYGPDDGHTAHRHCHVDGPVRTAGLTELTGAVQGVDDPEPPVARDVLEPLLGADIVVWIEAIQLLDEEVVGQPISGRTHASPGGRPVSQLQQGPTCHRGQGSRITVLGCEIHDSPFPLLDVPDVV